MHVVPVEEAKNLADTIGAPLFFTSAVTGQGVQDLFGCVVDRFRRDALNAPIQQET